MIRKMSFWQLVFEKSLTGFVCYRRKYIKEIPIRGNAFKIISPPKLTERVKKKKLITKVLQHESAEDSLLIMW